MDKEEKEIKSIDDIKQISVDWAELRRTSHLRGLKTGLLYGFVVGFVIAMVVF